MDKNETDQKLLILYAVIAVLLLLLVLETGILLGSRHRRESAKAKTERETVPRHSYQIPKESMPAPSTSRRTRPQLTSQLGFNDESADPFAAIERLQQRMNRLFDSAMMQAPSATGLRRGFDFNPALDMRETADAYIVTGDLPGLEKDKINVTVSGTYLTIQGVREIESTSDGQDGYYSQERSYGSFARTVTLPGPVDESKVKAEYAKGVLIITLPKTGSNKSSQKINVS